jgi:hypothetical protein
MGKLWDRLILIGPSLVLAGGLLIAFNMPQTGIDCETRLNDPAPLSDASREWLENCVDAFTPPTSPPTTPPATTAPPATTPPATVAPTPVPEGEFPTPATTGVPAGWTPTQTRTTDLRVTQPGAVIQDLRLVNASLIIAAPSVTVRRVQIEGGAIHTKPGGTCFSVDVEDTSIIRATGPTTGSEPVIEPGGYTARRVEINGPPEGFRVGAKASCGTTTILDSFALVRSPDSCGDWHGDTLQGYDGGALVVRHSTMVLEERGGCGGTAPFFYPRNQGNSGPVTVDRLLVKGGGYTFRMGMSGHVTGLRIVAGSSYGPIDVRCSVVNPWEAQVVTIDANYRILSRSNRTCNTESGF